MHAQCVRACTTFSHFLAPNSCKFRRIPDKNHWFFRSKGYGTRCSQAVPHPSTILARRCLTSVIGRERVCSSWYGRRQRKALASESQDVAFRSSCTRACILVCEHARTHLSMHVCTLISTLLSVPRCLVRCTLPTCMESRACIMGFVCPPNRMHARRRAKNLERFTNLRVILAQGPC